MIGPDNRIRYLSEIFRTRVVYNKLRTNKYRPFIDLYRYSIHTVGQTSIPHVLIMIQYTEDNVNISDGRAENVGEPGLSGCAAFIVVISNSCFLYTLVIYSYRSADNGNG